MVKPLIDKVINGINCTIFAYGQTGTGKSYTMGTDFIVSYILKKKASSSLIIVQFLKAKDDKNMGIIPRALNEFLSHINDVNKRTMEIAYYEIYNKKVYDLLSSDKNVLQIKGKENFMLSNDLLKMLSVFRFPNK